jgi:hypothetical protein
LFVSDTTETNWSLLKQFTSNDAVDAIAVNPKNSKVIAVSTVSWNSQAPCDFYLTRDGGNTWTQINGNIPDGAGASGMTWDPQGQNLYIARYAGAVWKINLPT